MKLLAGIALVVGCADPGGALDQATVGTECSPTDFACVTAGLDQPIALGGVLPLAVDLDTTGSSSSTVTLLSADPDVLKTSGTEVQGVGTGVAALVMLAEGRAIDFLHVFVVEPNRIGLHRRDGGLELGELSEDVELLVGDELVIAVEPYADSQRLLGHRETTWTSSPVLSLLREGTPARRRIVARAPGETDLVVGAFGFEKTLHIVVLP